MPSEPNARQVALDALLRIEADRSYANLALGPILERSRLDRRDRGFVTDLVYGTIRMQRRMDHLVDRFLVSDPPPEARMALRLGAYQLDVLATPPHAAIGETVEVTPKRYRGLVNAVLRKVSTGGTPTTWPSEAVRLSYPDWIVDRFVDELGAVDALAALDHMNQPPAVTTRDDGYIQDRASQWVADLVGGVDGELVADLCAAPGGKATAIAAGGAHVVAVDSSLSRIGLVADNVAKLELPVDVVAADALHPPWRPRSFDRVLLDAPCSGLGVLHRRPDARWRVESGDIDRLASLQRRMLSAAAELVRPGGVLVYSVCTLLRSETVGVAEALESLMVERGEGPVLEPLERPGGPWSDRGIGSILLPQRAETDGMYLARWRVGSGR